MPADDDDADAPPRLLLPLLLCCLMRLRARGAAMLSCLPCCFRADDFAMLLPPRLLPCFRAEGSSITPCLR